MKCKEYQTSICKVPNADIFLISCPSIVFNGEIIRFDIDHDWAKEQVARYINDDIKENELKKLFKDKGFNLYGQRTVKRKAKELIKKGYVRKGTRFERR